MLKYVRIAVTALSLTACLLLIALWVRSYTWSDLFNFDGPGTRAFQLQSVHGVVAASTFDSDGSRGGGWYSVPKQLIFYERNGRRIVTAPHWFIVATFAASGLVPWMPLRRFSLRTLLIATTLVAVGLGVVIYLAR